MKRSTIGTLGALALVGLFTLGSSGCLFFGGSKKSPLAGTKAAPDAVLYNTAVNDLKHGRYTVARLSLETLINTYPDSEYLAKAKLAIANSYYKQGGTEGLTQAVAQYKDFITFFPFLHEAAFAQYRTAMAHFRMMGKPDRDSTQALEAEAELQTMLLKYPHSQWTAQAEQRLREVQEVLAEGQFEISQFYYTRGAYLASAARLLELTKRYPLFSEADRANWMLGKIYQKGEDNKFAARFYQNIVREYPLSPLVPEAKKKLAAIGYPVPQPDPKALARMQKEETYEKKHHGGPGIFEDALDILKSGPDVSRAAHYGQPDLTPETNIVSARQVLEPSVVAKAVNSAALDLGDKITASSIDSDAGPVTTMKRGPSESTDSATGNSVSAVSVTAAPAGKAEAQPAKDPSAKSKQGEAKPASGKDKSKNKEKEKTAKKKKKSLLHKVIPW